MAAEEYIQHSHTLRDSFAWEKDQFPIISRPTIVLVGMGKNLAFLQIIFVRVVDLKKTKD